MNLIGLVFGAGFGFTLAGARLTDYDVIHRMLLFEDWQPFLILGSAIAVAAPLLRLLRRRRWQTPIGGQLTLATSGVRRRHVFGAAVFGTGWAVAGTCPGPAVAMVGTGHVLGLVVMAGLFGGIALRDAAVARAAARAGSPAPASTSTPEPLKVGL
jgi:uncharacterized membrane protein YedE/YeeE